MSALLSIADINKLTFDCRFVPIAETTRIAYTMPPPAPETAGRSSEILLRYPDAR